MINSQATARRAPTPGNNHAEITVRACRASVLDINFPQFDRLPPPAVRLMGLFFFFSPMEMAAFLLSSSGPY